MAVEQADVSKVCDQMVRDGIDPTNRAVRKALDPNNPEKPNGIGDPKRIGQFIAVWRESRAQMQQELAAESLDKQVMADLVALITNQIETATGDAMKDHLATVKRLEGELREAEQKETADEILIRSLNDSIKSLRTTEETLSSRNAELEAAAKQLREELQQERAKASKAVSKAEELKQSLEAKTAEYNQLSTANATLNKEHKELVEKYDNVVGELAAVREEVLSANKTLTANKDRIITLETDNKILTSEISSARAMEGRSTTAITQLYKTVAAQEGVIKSMSDELEQQRKLVAELRTEIAELKKPKPKKTPNTPTPGPNNPKNNS